MIQERSIGLGVIFEVVLATSIRAREITGILSSIPKGLVRFTFRLIRMGRDTGEFYNFALR
jgi:hypothetical protein